MWIQICLSLTVFVLTQKSASETLHQPSAPTNVSILCGTYKVEVRWDYPDIGRDVEFQVLVQYNSGQWESEKIRNRSMDISDWPFQSAYKTYAVTVTAVQGGNKSRPSTSVMFAFNQHATADIKCYLDFPEVELSPKDGKLHVSFKNPLRLYSGSPALRNNDDNLRYEIKAEEDYNELTCEMTAETCEADINFTKHDGNYCINLTGEIGQRLLTGRKRWCYTGDIRVYTPITAYLYPVLGVGLTLMVITAFIILLVKKYRAQIKKKASSALPHFLKDFGPPQCKTLEPKLENVVSSVLLEPADPETPLMENSINKELASATKELDNTDPDTTSTSVESEIVKDELGELSDGYDCPHALRVEMSPGDVVDAYGPRDLLLDL